MTQIFDQATIAAMLQQLQRDPAMLQRVNRDLTVGNDPSPFGCCNLFDPCSDGLFSLYYRGTLGLLDDFFNWQIVNDESTCTRSVDFINYVRPEQVDGVCSDGWVPDPCTDPNGYEWGTCSLTLDHFGRIGRVGPPRNAMNPKKYCQSSPLFTLDGERIMDENQWDRKMAMDVMINDLRGYIITGNQAASTGDHEQFDGFNVWINTGHACSMLDSIIIDWNGSPIGASAGATWNGAALLDGLSLVNVIQEIVRRFMERISWSPALMSSRMNIGDMRIIGPNSALGCLKDEVACWSLCATTTTDNYEAQTFRRALDGGMFGAGQIQIDNMTIPLQRHDWGIFNTPHASDFYITVPTIGATRIWFGELLSAEIAMEKGLGNMGYASMDGGRVLLGQEVDNTCLRQKVWMYPRLFCRAPYLQCRIQNVACAPAGGIFPPDPCSDYFGEDYMYETEAECPA